MEPSTLAHPVGNAARGIVQMPTGSSDSLGSLEGQLFFPIENVSIAQSHVPAGVARSQMHPFNYRTVVSMSNSAPYEPSGRSPSRSRESILRQEYLGSPDNSSLGSVNNDFGGRGSELLDLWSSRRSSTSSAENEPEAIVSSSFGAAFPVATRSFVPPARSMRHSTRLATMRSTSMMQTRSQTNHAQTNSPRSQVTNVSRTVSSLLRSSTSPSERSETHTDAPLSTTRKRDSPGRSEEDRKPPPKKRVKKENQKEEPIEYPKKPGPKEVSCCICLCEPTFADVSSIDGCDHKFCFGCIETWSNRENTCPLCKSRFTKISRVHSAKKKRGVRKTKRVKNRDQAADLQQGNPLQEMFANMEAGRLAPNIARLIFSGSGGMPGRLVMDAPTVSLSRQGIRVTSGSRVLPAINAVRGAEVNNAFSFAPFHGRFLHLHGQGAAGHQLDAAERERRVRFMGVVDEVEINDDSDEEDGDQHIVDNLLREVHDLHHEHETLERFQFRAAQPAQGSFAVNFHDLDAGVSADNALEITDDSDDEDVEIVNGPGLS